MKIKTRIFLVGNAWDRRNLARAFARCRNVWVGILLIALVASGSVFLAGCQSSQETLDAEMAAAVARQRAEVANPSTNSHSTNVYTTDFYSTNLLEEGDVVGISFRYSTNFDTIEKIGLDGTLNLDVAGQVQAANKTVLELQNELTKLYQSEVKDDPITVKIITPEAAVYVSGAVNRPGKIPLEHPMTVLDAIMEAGGSDPLEADLSDVLVLRVENNREHTYHINVRRLLDGKDSTVFYVKPFDTVRVPAKIINY